MPYRPRSPCTYPGCPEYAVDGGRCTKHKRQAWEGRRGFEGYGGEYKQIRKQVLREERHCAICGEPAVTVDHILAVSAGGTHARENLRGLCKDCHDKRSKAQAGLGQKRGKRTR